MGDIVDAGSAFGRQNVFLCVTSHTSTTNIAEIFGANWQQIAIVTNLDDGHLLRYRGRWQPNTDYSADPITAGEGGDGDDFDIERTKIPQRLNILLRPAAPEVHSGYEEDALGLGIKIAMHDPIVYNGPKAAEGVDAVESVLRHRMFMGGDPPDLGAALNPYRPYAANDGWIDGDEFPALRPLPDRRVYFETDPDAEPPLKADPTWAVFVVRETARTQTDLAGRRFDVNGALIIDVRTPVLKVSVDKPEANAAMETAKAFQKLYDSGTVAGAGIRIYLTGSRINPVGPEGKWYMVRVEAPFRYYDTR